jgi:hypothetical protein
MKNLILDRPTFWRYVGNALLIVGYIVLLWGDLTFGLCIKLIGGTLILPSLYYLKMWDGMILCGFFTTIEIGKLYDLLGP